MRRERRFDAGLLLRLRQEYRGRHAVDRVLMRRRIREAFRLQWHPLRKTIQDDPNIRTLSLAIVYMHTENSDMEAISSAVASALAKIRKKLYSQPKGDNIC